MNFHPVNSSRRYGAYSYKQTQRGVGLIEVLIAVLVLSIGILGIAALQTRALADNGSSLNRSAATAASYSIIEAMRLDRKNAVTNSAYNGTVTTNACPAQGSTLATWQLNNWCSNQLAKFLGTVSTTKGIINCQSTGDCDVKIQYDESNATGGNSSFTLETKATI